MPNPDDRPATAPSWFADEQSLLVELKHARGSVGPAPNIEGYDDLVELARGGQGVVYLATQRSARRRVAIKVLHGRALESESARRRIEREIEVVAGIRHPNVVRLHDSGRTGGPDGRTWLAMEHIAGQPLDEFVRERLPGCLSSASRGATTASTPTSTPAATSSRRERHADLQSLVALMALVCDGVHAAHLRGVIHRDLKPSNIRVDVDGVPHVLDFGLAKVEPAPGSDAASITATASGLFLGSLPWTSPEQAAGRNDAVDLRSDVYALGAVLYQMLTGRTPSTVDGGLHRTLTSIVSEEPVSPRSLNRNLDGDLETIVMKCLEKDPTRRYQGAHELAADLRHWLAGEPIAARRASAWYTMGRRLRRYRLVTGVALAGAALFAIATVAALAQTREARTQQRIAERRFDDVRTLARAVIFDVHDAIAGLPGSNPAREMLVTTALRHLDDLAADAEGNRALQLERAGGYRRVGDIQGNPYGPNLGDTSGALASYGTAHDITAALIARDGDDRDALALLVELELAIGDVLLFRGDRSGSLERFDAAAALATRLAESDSDPDVHRRTLGSIAVKRGDTISYQGDWETAIAHYRDALAIYADLPGEAALAHRAVAHNKVGFGLRMTGEHSAALAEFRAGLEIAMARFEAEPESPARARDLNIAHNNVGSALALLGRHGDAAEHHRAALDIAERLAEDDPRNALARADLTFTLNRLGEALSSDDRDAEALPHFERALDIRRALHAADPGNASVRRDLCVSLFKVASVTETVANETASSPAARHDALAHAATLFAEAADHMESMERDGTLNEVDHALPAMLRSRADAAQAALEDGESDQ